MARSSEDVAGAVFELRVVEEHLRCGSLRVVRGRWLSVQLLKSLLRISVEGSHADFEHRGCFARS